MTPREMEKNFFKFTNIKVLYIGHSGDFLTHNNMYELVISNYDESDEMYFLISDTTSIVGVNKSDILTFGEVRQAKIDKLLDK